VVVLIEDEIATGGNHGPGSDLIFREVVTVVAEEPAAEVEGLIRSVVQFDPVGLAGGGIG